MTQTVERLSSDDWKTWRELRLAALQEAPYAFGSTYERERAFGEPEWRVRVDSPAGAAFVARLDGEPVGIAAGYLPPDGDDDVAMLVAMWVDPAARGQRVAERLVTAVVDWARGTGRGELELETTAGNDAAARAYERCGFTPFAGVPSTPDGSVWRLPLR